MRSNDIAPPCPSCGGPRTTYISRSARRGTQKTYYCPPCRRQRYDTNAAQIIARVTRYQQTHPDQVRKKRDRWGATNRDRVLLIHRNGEAVRRAVRDGVLVRATACEQCGVSDKPLEAAHFDYALPLMVRWLCRSCHRRWDQSDPKSYS
jgi:hypothetical protein